MSGMAGGLILIAFVFGVVSFVTLACLIWMFDTGRAKMEEINRLAGKEPTKKPIRFVIFIGFLELLGLYRDTLKKVEEDRDS